MLACYGVSSMVPKKQATTSLVVGKVIEFTTAQSLRNDFESKWVDFSVRGKKCLTCKPRLTLAKFWYRKRIEMVTLDF